MIVEEGHAPTATHTYCPQPPAQAPLAQPEQERQPQSMRLFIHSPAQPHLVASHIHPIKKQVTFASTVQVIPASASLHLHNHTSWTESVGEAAPADEEDDMVHDTSWYSASELENIRDEVRDLCRKLRVVATDPCAAGSEEDSPAASASSENHDNHPTSLETKTAKTDQVFAIATSWSVSPTSAGSGSSNSSDGTAAVVKTCSMALSAASRGLESRVCTERQRRRYLATKCVVRAQSKLMPDRLAGLSMRCTQWAADLAQKEATLDYERAYLLLTEGNHDEGQPDHDDESNEFSQNSQRIKRALPKQDQYDDDDVLTDRTQRRRVLS